MLARPGLAAIVGVARGVIGMVHLPPLPGSPRWGGSMEGVISAALRDAEALAAGGVDALLVENFGDAPFSGGRVGAETVAAMVAAAREVARVVRLPLGVNVLRSDGVSALAVALAVGARFIRVKVQVGAGVRGPGL